MRKRTLFFLILFPIACIAVTTHAVDNVRQQASQKPYISKLQTYPPPACYDNEGCFVYCPAKVGFYSFRIIGTIALYPFFIAKNAIVEQKLSIDGAGRASVYTFGFLGFHLIGAPCYLIKKTFWDGPCYLYNSIFEDAKENE